MKISENGLNLIKHFESLHDGDLKMIGLQPKMCPAGIWTEGWGEAILYNGEFLKGKENKDLAYKLANIHTEEEANARLLITIVKYEKAIDKLGLKLEQYQFDALVSFVYNLGPNSIVGSTLLKRIKSSIGDIEAAFGMWNKCDGKVLKGLTLRRQAEATLFLKGLLKL